MGDSLFFHCIKGYLQEYKFKDVNSYKLRDYLVSCSGLNNINDFFTDWIFDGGFPDFSIEHIRVINTATGADVNLSIRQRSDHTSHLFHNVPVEIAFFDQTGGKTVQTANVSGECTQFTASLPFYPAYIALDFDEKLSDAVTDQWFKMVGSNHQYDFGEEKMSIYLKQSSDTSLVRVEHHWVAPDASRNIFTGLHLSDYRYWTVDGLWSSDFRASATVYYNGTNGPLGYLDNTFITNSEDSLVLMYRPDAESIWQIDTDAKLNTIGSAKDKVGFIRINSLQKGQYALAIYDANKVDLPQSVSVCAPMTAAATSSDTIGFRAYTNPAHSDELNVEMPGSGEYKRCIMIDMIGETVMDRPLRDGQTKFMVYMNGLPRGTYRITMIDKENKRISKNIQKVN